MRLVTSTSGSQKCCDCFLRYSIRTPDQVERRRMKVLVEYLISSYALSSDVKRIQQVDLI